ncbi:MAG TPA: alcohol dehydrogenase catalytic domain-containing protein, partial [Candidatus Binatia bacterium]|nr:alcohol dehydrogenase catalytic domain-containing protein [Candidatus Binatia bacterium]
EPGPQDVLVQVAATGLGPGPVIWWQHGMTQPLPVTPGHEIAGTVASVGSAVDGVQTGDRVRVHANLTCRDCVLCSTDREPLCARASILGGLVFGPEGVELNAPYHDGGLAEYVRVPAWLLDPLPESLPFAVAARAHDVGVANRALKLASLEPGGVVVVLAATGAMGAATIRLAPLFGVSRVVAVGRSRSRLERVRALDPGLVEVIALEELPEGGAAQGVLAGAIRKLAPEGAQAVVDYLGDGRLAAAAALGMRNGGTVVLIGAGREPLALPTGLLMANGLRVVGSRSCTRRDAREVLELLRTGRLAIDDLVTHRMPLQDVNEAVAELTGRSEGAWLITVDVGAPAAGGPAAEEVASR